MENDIDRINEICLDFIETLSGTTGESDKRLLMRRHLTEISDIPGKSVVPDFKPGLEWLNVTEPLSLRRHLKGKIVVLDFFTYCCINCMHILPELKLLEKEFPVEDGLVVIGVHSAKFPNERSTANIESAVKRYEVYHPIVNDSLEGMWNNLGICCWPTLYVLGPHSEPLLMLQGEGNFNTLKMFISEAIQFFRLKKSLSLDPLPVINPFERTVKSNILLYPGKINVNKSGTIIGISDTNNHRVLVLSLDGDLLHEVGGLDSGFADGTFSSARFSSPQGLAFHKDLIFVADTENHAIREINLSTKVVRTIVGNGKQGHDYSGGLEGVSQQISSPWDVCLVNDILFIAMAGTHQVWAYFPEDSTLWKKTYKKGMCAAVVGSGKEENRNNQYPMSCGLAQPSGLTYNNNGLMFIADSESSTVRSVSMESGAVTSLVGGSKDPKNLFAFGDSDGTGVEAKLQHPLAVTWSPYDGCIYIADSYNHKIKRVNKDTKQCSTVGDYSKYQLNEPGGLCALGDKLLIADTNNHCIKVMNFPSNTLSSFDIHFVDNMTTHVDIVNEHTVTLSTAGGVLHLSCNLILPEGVSVTSDAPSKWIINLPGNRMLPLSENFTLTPEWDINVNKNEFMNEIIIKCRIFLCSGTKCFVKELNFAVKIQFTDNAPLNADCHVNHNLLLDM